MIGVLDQLQLHVWSLRVFKQTYGGGDADGGIGGPLKKPCRKRQSKRVVQHQLLSAILDHAARYNVGLHIV